MSASQPALFNVQEFTDNGITLVGGRLYTYAFGTTAQKVAYTDPEGTVPQTYTADGLGGQYIALNARGELPTPLYLGKGVYDISLKRADGTTVWTRRADGVDNLANLVVENLAADQGAAMVGFVQAGAGAIVRPIQSELRERAISVRQFGAVADWNGATGTDNTAAFQAALNFAAINGRSVFVPVGSYRITKTLVMDTSVYTIGQIMYGEGRNSLIYQSGADQDGIHLSTTQFLQNGGLRDLAITCAVSAGHCVNIVYGCTTCFVSNVELVALNPVKSCTYGDYTSSGGGIYDTKFSGGSWYLSPTSIAGGFVIRANGTFFNENMFENLRVYQANTKQFFDIRTVGQTDIFLVNNSWKNINVEVCRGGGFIFDAFKNCTFENISFWDSHGPYTNNLIDMVAGVSYENAGNTFINVTRNGDSLAPSVRDIRIVSGQDTIFINCYTPIGHGPSYDFSNKRATVIGRMINIENRNNTSVFLPELTSTPSVVADSVAGGTLVIGGRGLPETAAITYAGGFVQITPLPASSGIILNSKNAGGVQTKVVFSATEVYPLTDNAVSLGLGAQRWSQVYAATGTINTSDEHSKMQVGAVGPAILRAWGKVEFYQYKFCDAVALKGGDARWHFGVVAQRVKEAFESEGLDAFAYGLLCYDEWPATPAVLDAAGEVVVPARDAGSRYGIRYEEALVLECAYLRSRLLAAGASG